MATRSEAEDIWDDAGDYMRRFGDQIKKKPLTSAAVAGVEAIGVAILFGALETGVALTAAYAVYRAREKRRSTP